MFDTKKYKEETGKVVNEVNAELNRIKSNKQNLLGISGSFFEKHFRLEEQNREAILYLLENQNK